MVRQWLERSLRDVVPRNHRETTRALRRRQCITLGFVLLGALVLSFSLRLEPGSNAFYGSTVALAGVWIVGAFSSGPLHLGRIERRDIQVRPIVQPIALGLALSLVFAVGGLVVSQIGPLARQVAKVLDFADQGSLPILIVITAVNGIAEELFFRGAGYAAIPRNPVTWTTVAYAIATAATGNIMLTFAAILLGVLVGLQRRASGGILAPILTHCTWSFSMLIVLPLIFHT